MFVEARRLLSPVSLAAHGLVFLVSCLADAFGLGDDLIVLACAAAGALFGLGLFFFERKTEDLLYLSLPFYVVGRAATFYLISDLGLFAVSFARGP